MQAVGVHPQYDLNLLVPQPLVDRGISAVERINSDGEQAHGHLQVRGRDTERQCAEKEFAHPGQKRGLPSPQRPCANREEREQVERGVDIPVLHLVRGVKRQLLIVVKLQRVLLELDDVLFRIKLSGFNKRTDGVRREDKLGLRDLEACRRIVDHRFDLVIPDLDHADLAFQRQLGLIGRYDLTLNDRAVVENNPRPEKRRGCQHEK